MKFRDWLESVILSLVVMVGGAACSATGEEKVAQPSYAYLRASILEQFPEAGARLSPLQSSSRERVRLGEALFFDPNLSSCGAVACASCHLPEQGYSDARRVSEGCGGAQGRRNSMSIYNTSLLSHLFWDGRSGSLEEQAAAPVTDPLEMANSWEDVVHYLSTGEHRGTGLRYPESKDFYQGSFETNFDGEITISTVTRALAAYERTVLTADSPFDRWLGGEDDALTLKQKRGAAIFFGRAMCSECHPPPRFTDSDFHNVGVPRAGFEEPADFPFNNEICGGIGERIDPGRAAVSDLDPPCSELGKFRTPTLRNVSLTKPYMHNGRFVSLESVLQHYWRAGRGTAGPLVGELDPKVRLVALTDFGGHPDDFVHLVSFLEGLSGTQVAGPPGGIAPPSGQ